MPRQSAAWYVAAGVLLLAATIGHAKGLVPVAGTYVPFTVSPTCKAGGFVHLESRLSERLDATADIKVHNGSFVDSSGQRVRLFGTNITRNMAFPPRDRGRAYAGCLEKLGFNIVRFLGIDRAGQRDSIWLEDLKQFDAEVLDRFDWFVAELRRRGIRIWLTLHATREYAGTAPLPGFPGLLFRRGLDNFVEKYVREQKVFARMLLTHRNPYSGFTYAEDPFVTVVEINNESALSAIPFNRITALPDEFKSRLETRWQDCLLTRIRSLPAELPLTLDKAVQRDTTREEFSRFLSSIELNYAQEMTAFLRRELAVRSNVVVTQSTSGGALGLLRSATAGDFTDAHAYWDHPVFNGKPFSQTEWTISHRRMSGNVEESPLLAKLLMRRVAGRPYTVSEYDHAAPSQYAAEGLPMLASFASFQDWDGILQYAYHTHGPAAGGQIGNWFELGTHPGKFVFAPIASLVFRGALVPPAQSLRIPVSMDELVRIYARHGSQSIGELGALQRWGLCRRVELQATEQAPPISHTVSKLGPVPRCLEPLHWESIEDGWSLYTAVAPAVRIATGRLQGKAIGLGDVTLRIDRARNGFATFGIVAMDGKPLKQSKKMLIAIVGDVQNSSTEWNTELSSVVNVWGNGPTLAEVVEGAISMPGRVAVFSLDGDGFPLQQIPTAYRDGRSVLRLQARNKTIWYAVTRRTSDRHNGEAQQPYAGR
jgi:hypothetical protein